MKDGHVKDEPVKNAVQDVAEDVTQDVAAEVGRRGGRKRKVVYRGARHLPPPPTLSLGDT